MSTPPLPPHPATIVIDTTNERTLIFFSLRKKGILAEMGATEDASYKL